MVIDFRAMPDRQRSHRGRLAAAWRYILPEALTRLRDRVPALQIVSAVGQIEALVAQGKIRDLFPAQGYGQPHPVMKGWINDLVGPEGSVFVGNAYMADFSAPAFNQSDGRTGWPEASLEVPPDSVPRWGRRTAASEPLQRRMRSRPLPCCAPACVRARRRYVPPSA